MNYVKVAQTTDFLDGSKKKITLNGKDILLTNVKNVYYAIDKTCSHMGGSLVDGNLEGYEIICPRHGTRYDVRTGKVVQRGKLFFISVSVHDLHAYPVKIEKTDVFIGVE